MKPLLSIVIANYNYGRYLEDAICSVLSQEVGDRIELIICDAASTDNSVEIIKKYADKLAWWCSERDGGQSAAFNKGFSHAKGKYLTWLNADDVFVPGCIKKVLRQFERHPECQWFTGNGFRFLEDGRVMQANWGPHYYPKFLQKKNSPVVVFGPSSFFTQEVYKEVGGIDEQLHYVMDTDLWLRFMHNGVTQRRINCMIWAFRMHEASKTAEFGSHQMDEKSHARLVKESRIATENLGYRMSWWLHFAVRLWRFFDGSMVYRAYLRMAFRRFCFRESN